ILNVTVSNFVASGASPTVAITSPSNGSSVQRNTTATITAIASDSVAITKVEFYVGGKLLGSDANAPYSASWKVPNKSGAAYTIQVIAYDALGKTASATATVTAK